ncbi:hypothetical protein F8163_17690 [Bacillus luti]|uniref:Uncharacterized protein n=1 Tax=Bacillus luti TaxID=2026191 RepID=A0A7V7S5X1_9BACI|nr:hypothetical protein F8163_17690 [Bacillus luti]
MAGTYIKNKVIKMIKAFQSNMECLLLLPSILNYSPLNVLTDCLKWEIPKYRSLAASNSLGYPRSSYG